MAFHDDRLPVDIEVGSKIIAGFSIGIVGLDSDFESRNQRSKWSRHRYDIGYPLRYKDDATLHTSIEQIRSFFYARRASLHSFPFKDWIDYELTRQVIGTTDGSTAMFQMKKTYTSGGYTTDRELYKIVSGSVSVWVNNVSISAGGGASQYQIDLNTGIVTLGSTLAAQSGTAVEAACEFNVPCRFESNELELELLLPDRGSFPQIPIIEVRIDENGDG